MTERASGTEQLDVTGHGKVLRPRELGLIWAQARGAVIGSDGTMPWHLPEDLAFFKRATMGAAVIMGRGTWNSLPARFRPLPGRENIVISRTLTSAPGAVVVRSVDDARGAAAHTAAPAWVVGGAQVYAQTLAVADLLVVTQIDLDVAGDAFAPQIDDSWVPDPGAVWLQSTTALRYRHLVYRRAADLAAIRGS